MASKFLAGQKNCIGSHTHKHKQAQARERKREREHARARGREAQAQARHRHTAARLITWCYRASTSAMMCNGKKYKKMHLRLSPRESSTCFIQTATQAVEHHSNPHTTSTHHWTRTPRKQAPEAYSIFFVAYIPADTATHTDEDTNHTNTTPS